MYTTIISLFFIAFLSFTFLVYPVAAVQLSPRELASQYSLTTSTTFPFPTATQSSDETDTFIASEWSLSRGRFQDGSDNVAFVGDPFTANSSSPVLEVTYPEGSFSHGTGGTQFYNLWNASNGGVFQSLMLSYDIAFDKDFDWVKGGKLPGVRGGPNATGCSGGNQPTGSDCFSVRLMWRQEGAAEVYAYIPTPNNLCSERSITCNDDFGTSISRGAFSFVTGEWNQVTLLVQLNDPASVANGNLKLYYNDVEVISQTDLQFRSSSSIDAGGMYFSTFFGGSDDSWATPNTTHTYFRNITMWGGSNPSNLTGLEVTSAASSSWISQLWTTLLPVFLTVGSLCM